MLNGKKSGKSPLNPPKGEINKLPDSTNKQFNDSTIQDNDPEQ